MANQGKLQAQNPPDLMATASALQEDEARYPILVDQIPAAIYVDAIDETSSPLFQSPQVEFMFGFSAADWRVNPNLWAERLHPEDHARTISEHLRTNATGEPFRMEYRFLAKNGGVVWVRDEAVIIRDAQGNPLHWQGVMFNITAQKRSEMVQESIYRISEAVHATRNLNELFSSIHQIISSLMPASNFYIALYEPTSQTLSFPYFQDEFDENPQSKTMGRGLTEYVLRTGFPLLASPQIFDALVAQGEVESVGAPSIDWMGVPLKAGGQTLGAMVVQSYTEGVRFQAEDLQILDFVSKQVAMAIARKRSDEALSASEALYRSVVETTPDAIVLIDLDGKIRMVNQRTAAMYGVEQPGQMIGMEGSQIIAPEDREPVGSMIREAFVQTKALSMECTMLRQDQTRFWAELSILLIRNQQGEPESILGLAHDITRRKQTDEILQQRIRFETLITTISSNFINLAIGEVNHEIQRALQQIGQFAEVDRSYLFLFSPDLERLTNTHEWCAPGITSYIDQLQDIPSDRFPWLMNQLRHLDTVYLPRVADLPDEARNEKEECLSQSIRSLLLVPISYGNVLEGYLGFDAVRSEKRWTEQVIALLKIVGEVIVNSLKRKQGEQNLRQSIDQLQLTLAGTVQALASTAEIRDPYTVGHQNRVAQLACAIARELDMPEDQVEGLRIAGALHDLGKIYIPTEILTKPGRLSNVEMALIRNHPQISAEILAKIPFPWPISQMVLQHHERMDGSGYPHQLKGEEIMLEARILAVSDVVEAMTFYRPYRPGFGIQEALWEIMQNRGVLYDLQIAELCVKLFNEARFEFR
jgi:PAS domain S-box-containing protein/putative nucleotidyltransferase with HDIG domain